MLLAISLLVVRNIELVCSPTLSLCLEFSKTISSYWTSLFLTLFKRFLNSGCSFVCLNIIVNSLNSYVNVLNTFASKKYCPPKSWRIFSLSLSFRTGGSWKRSPIKTIWTPPNASFGLFLFFLSAISMPFIRSARTIDISSIITICKFLNNSALT